MDDAKTINEIAATGSERVEPVHRRIWRRVRRPVWVAVRIYLLGMLIAMFFEEKLIFFPTRFPGGEWQPAGLSVEDAHFTTADGVQVHGWYCAVREPRGVVLMSHGNAGNISHRADEIRLWQRHLKVSVFIYDYRGFGRSGGSPNETGVYEDARAAYRWLVEEKKLPADQIVLRGESIGSAVSLQLALEVPHRALIMESPFTSAVEMGQRSFPWLPVRLVMRNRFDSINKISRYRRPLLITHGTNDSIVPHFMGQKLFDRANEPKRFYSVPNADHNDVPFVGGSAYFQAISEFLNDL